MTIKSSLQASIAIVKAFWREIFCPVKNWPKIYVLWVMGSKCKFLGGGQKTYPCAKRHLTYRSWKSVQGVFSVRRRQNAKKTNRVTLYAPASTGAGREAKSPYRIVMKFCTGICVPHIISHAKFCGHRFMGIGDSGGGGQIFQFSINFHWLSLSSLKVSDTTVPACDNRPFKEGIRFPSRISWSPNEDPLQSLTFCTLCAGGLNNNHHQHRYHSVGVGDSDTMLLVTSTFALASPLWNSGGSGVYIWREAVGWQ